MSSQPPPAGVTCQDHRAELGLPSSVWVSYSKRPATGLTTSARERLGQRPPDARHLHDPLRALSYRAGERGTFDDVVDAGVPLGQAIDVDQRGEYRFGRCGEPGGVAAMELSERTS